MESTEILNEIREEIATVVKRGLTQVSVEALTQYLAALEKDADQSAEHRRREHEGMLVHSAAVYQSKLEIFKAVLEAGKSAIDALLIINGGAVVALLGMLSNLAGKGNGDVLARNLANPLLFLASAFCWPLLRLPLDT